MGHTPRRCSPISYSLLCYVVSTLPPGYDYMLYRAMLSLGYFGALRGSEYAAVGDLNGTLRALTMAQVQFINLHTSYGLVLTLTKTKASSSPVTKYIGCSGQDVCAVCNLIAYLQLKQQLSGLHPQAYLFTDPGGRPITKDRLNIVIKSAMCKLGLPAAGFSTHSLRAGAATTASSAGFQDNEIKMLGHWASSAYTRYIHKSIQEQFNFASRLAQDDMQDI